MTNNNTVLPWAVFVLRGSNVKYKLFSTRATARTFAKVSRATSDDHNTVKTVVTRDNSRTAKMFYALRHTPDVVDTKVKPVLVLKPTTETTKPVKVVTRIRKAQTDFPLFASLV